MEDKEIQRGAYEKYPKLKGGSIRKQVDLDIRRTNNINRFIEVAKWYRTQLKIKAVTQ